MSRQLFFNHIEDKLNTLATRINSRGRLNFLDLHNHSETFFQFLLNELYGWETTNENAVKVNVEAIDLIDHINKFVVQISATNTKQKIEDSLSKALINKYKDYTFKFVSISKDADELRKMTFTNPHNINFNPKTDIIDKNSIIKYIKGLEIGKLEFLYSFIKKELGNEIDFLRLETNLANIINILSKENWDKKDSINQINAFEIDRKIIHNNLKSAIIIINDYSIHYGQVDKIYKEFDESGNNKSKSVLASISKEYSKAKNSLSDDELFFEILEKVIDRIINSSNYVAIPYEELELCVNIIVVDAFIRCRIFENPQNYNYVTT